MYNSLILNINIVILKIRRYIYLLVLQKKFLKDELKIKFDIDKVRYIYWFKILLGNKYYALQCIEFLTKTLLKLRRIKAVRRFRVFNTYKIYGLTNLRIRVRKFYFLIKPKWFNDDISKLNIKSTQPVAFSRLYRYWKFSKNVFRYFKKFRKLYYIYKGYPSYMEVSYKAHMLLLTRNPSVRSIVYPFSFEKDMLFVYFKRKAYF